MKLSELNVDKFVEVNKLQPVTSIAFFEQSGAPAEGGLFSTQIFGRPGSEERERRWAYIDLGGRFFHPLVYKTITQIDRNFPSLISGQDWAILTKSGEIQYVDEGTPGAFQGIDELYKRWPQITWGAYTKGTQRGERVEMLITLREKRASAFVTKWPVIPALYRDVDTKDTSPIKEVPPLNMLYAQLMATAPQLITGLSFADGNRKLRAQNTLVDIHWACLAPQAGKRGLFQDRLLGKYTDWATRGVLSAPSLTKSESPFKQEIMFGELGVPLYLMVNMVQPFFIKRLTEIFSVYANDQEIIRYRDKNGEVKQFEFPPDARAMLNSDTYRRWVSQFMRSQENRLDVLSVTTPRGKTYEIPLYDMYLGRKTLLVDLFFIAAADICNDKHVIFTRYPVEDFRAPHFARPVILTTEKTMRVELGNEAVGKRVFENYPVITSPVRWIDSYRLHNSYTANMGADFDGRRLCDGSECRLCQGFWGLTLSRSVLIFQIK